MKTYLTVEDGRPIWLTDISREELDELVAWAQENYRVEHQDDES